MDNAKRFTRSSQVGAYFGLVPCQDASAGVNRLGHITRQGPATARKYLVEAAWQGVYRSPTIRAYFERVQHGRPERRKIALVATATTCCGVGTPCWCGTSRGTRRRENGV